MYYKLTFAMGDKIKNDIEVLSLAKDFIINDMDNEDKTFLIFHGSDGQCHVINKFDIAWMEFEPVIDDETLDATDEFLGMLSNRGRIYDRLFDMYVDEHEDYDQGDKLNI